MDIRYLQGYGFVCAKKSYPKEACDVRTQYSSILPLSSNQNCPAEGHSGSHRSSHPGTTRQAIPTRLPRVRQQSIRRPQLDPAQGSRSEYDHSQALGHMSVSQGILCPLPWRPHRRLATVSSVSAGNRPFSPLHLSALPDDDRLRGGSAHGTKLEDGQRYRQILFGARPWPARLKWFAYFGRRRDLHPQGSSLFDRGTGLSQRPGGLCRQRPQGQNTEALLQSAKRSAARWH
jgi:hypothetical protein